MPEPISNILEQYKMLQLGQQPTHESSTSENILEQYKNLQQSGHLDELEKLKKDNKEMERIIEDTSQLIQLTNIDDMFTLILSKILDYFIPEYLIFLIKPPRSVSLRQYTYRQLKKSDEKLPEHYYDLFKSFFELEQTQITPYYTFDEISSRIGNKHFTDDFTRYNPHLIIPLTGIGGVYGTAILSKKILGNNYTNQELNYIEKIFRVLAVTIQNGLHYETSIRDPKTGLYTYDYFVTRLKESILLAKRYNRFSGMIMVDIDFFKKINDTWGHIVGDRVLVALADTLLETVRTSDCVARFGGEEFSIIIQECNNESLFIAAERIRKAVEKINVIEKDGIVKLTISTGACMIDNTKSLSPKYIIKKADQALYYSKQHGRNRSTVINMGLLDKSSMLLEQENIPEKD